MCMLAVCASRDVWALWTESTSYASPYGVRLPPARVSCSPGGVEIWHLRFALFKIFSISYSTLSHIDQATHELSITHTH